jgi:hypothetical protein
MSIFTYALLPTFFGSCALFALLYGVFSVKAARALREAFIFSGFLYFIIVVLMSPWFP